MQNDKYAELSDVLKIRSSKLFEHISKLQADNLPTFSYLLATDFAVKKQEKAAISFTQPVPKTKVSVKSMDEIPRYELDLHIEALLENTKGLTNAEMLQIQLSTLNKYLRIAVNNYQDKMVVVHGVGKGVLRQEVQRVLQQNPNVDSIETGWQAGYGFGATIIFFKY